MSQKGLQVSLAAQESGSWHFIYLETVHARTGLRSRQIKHSLYVYDLVVYDLVYLRSNLIL